MRLLAIPVAVLAVSTLGPASAQAQGYFSPNIGYDFGGDAGNCPSLFKDCSEKKTSFGVAVGFLARGIFGFEEDFSYAPDFFGKSASFGDNSVLTMMSNIVVGVPAGPIRPFASAGIGLIRTKVGFNVASLTAFSNNALGYDFGGGVMAFLPYHLGIRGDFRYIRSAKEMTILGISLNSSQLNFARASIGLVLH